RSSLKAKAQNLMATLRLSAWNPLQARLLSDLEARGLSFSELCRQIGVDDQGMRLWFRTSDRAMRASRLQLIASYLGIPYELAVAEAGGATSSDKHRELSKSVIKERVQFPCRQCGRTLEYLLSANRYYCSQACAKSSLRRRV